MHTWTDYFYIPGHCLFLYKYYKYLLCSLLHATSLIIWIMQLSELALHMQRKYTCVLKFNVMYSCGPLVYVIINHCWLVVFEPIIIIIFLFFLVFWMVLVYVLLQFTWAISFSTLRSFSQMKLIKKYLRITCIYM